jgi:putative FmdB family regulatory protein
MILYDFECTNPECKHCWEESVSYEDSHKMVCPICGEPADKVFTKGPTKHVSWSSWAV